EGVQEEVLEVGGRGDLLRRRPDQQDLPADGQGREPDEDRRVREAADRLLLRRLQGQVRIRPEEVHREGEGVQEEEVVGRGGRVLRGPDQQDLPAHRQGRQCDEDGRLRRTDDRLLLRRLQGQVRIRPEEVHREGE